jgi:hypothetical protein
MSLYVVLPTDTQLYISLLLLYGFFSSLDDLHVRDMCRERSHKIDPIVPNDLILPRRDLQLGMWEIPESVEYTYSTEVWYHQYARLVGSGFCRDFRSKILHTNA